MFLLSFRFHFWIALEMEHYLGGRFLCSMAGFSYFCHGWAASFRRGRGASSSGLPDLNLPAPESSEEGDPNDKRRAVEEALLSLELEKKRKQKKVPAEKIGPLIEEESKKYPSIRGTLPSPTEMVEKLFSRIGSPAAKEANQANAPLHKLRHLKTWLTRVCNNAEDFRKGDLNVQAGHHF